MKQNRSETPFSPCPSCRIGRMRKITMTWFAFSGGRMITIPDFPGWKCDICNNSQLDHEALDQLSLLLNPQPRARKSAYRTKTAGDLF